MKKPIVRRTHPTNISSPPTATLPWSYLVVIALCGCVLAAGFFLAARQHFTSMDFGMKNSKLRKQLEDLESENRRLLLAREISLSPAEITRTARNLGFMAAIQPTTSLLVRAFQKGTMNASVKAVAVNSTSDQLKPSAVTLTSFHRPAIATAFDTPLKRKTVEKQIKKGDTAKERPINSQLTASAKFR